MCSFKNVRGECVPLDLSIAVSWLFDPYPYILLFQTSHLGISESSYSWVHQATETGKHSQPAHFKMYTCRSGNIDEDIKSPVISERQGLGHKLSELV